MTKPTKQQLQEEALEKRFGIPAVVLTLVTIVFSLAVNNYSFDFDTEGKLKTLLTGVAIIAVIVNLVTYVYVKLGLLRGIFIVSGFVCTLVAAWTWFMASLSITFRHYYHRER